MINTENYYCANTAKNIFIFIFMKDNNPVKSKIFLFLAAYFTSETQHHTPKTHKKWTCIYFNLIVLFKINVLFMINSF